MSGKPCAASIFPLMLSLSKHERGLLQRAAKYVDADSLHTPGRVIGIGLKVDSHGAAMFDDFILFRSAR